MKLFYLEKCTWEIDYLKYDILHNLNIEIEIINDNTFFEILNDSNNINNCIVIIHHSLPFQKTFLYLKKLRPVIIFQLSDEYGKYVKWLSLASLTQIYFRQYNHKNYLIHKYTNVTQIPLGYMKNMLEQQYSLDLCLKKSSERKYDWSFIGGLKRDRIEMINKFTNCLTNNYCITDGSIKPEQMKGIYEESIFIPNGRGNVTLDCFRLYEACLLGAIPVIVGNNNEIETVFYYNGNKPPFLYFDNWDNAIIECKKLLGKKEELNKVQTNLLIWWKNQIVTIQDKIKNIINIL